MSKRAYLYGLCAAALVLGLAPLVGVALRGEAPGRVPSSDEQVALVEPAAQPAGAPQPHDPPDEPGRPASEDEPSRSIRASDRYAPPELAGAGVRRVVAEEPIGRLPRPDSEDAKERNKRRNDASEEVLLAQLARGEEVGLGKAGAHVIDAYVSHAETVKTVSHNKGSADVTPLIGLRADLRGLPFRDGPASTLDDKAATELQTLSRKLRVYINALAPAGPDGRRVTTRRLRDQLRKDLRGKKPEWLRPEAVPTLTQMMMGEDARMRRLLVELLAAIPGKRSAAALASRAAFDLSPDVRDAAVAALEGRDPEHWRPVLLSALRYPWAPPADFAAEALVGLKDTGAVPELVALLKLPAAGRAYLTPGKRMLVREVVRINHLRNCMLCHPPALRGNEPVLGVDPVQVLPASFAKNNPALLQTLRTMPYYDGGPQRAAKVAALVRADITFLRQDFSVVLPGSVPGAERFDYVVRTRQVTPAERKRWESLEDTTDRQREALLYALRELTGRDEGDTTKAWVKAYPLAEAEVRSKRHAETLVRTEGLERTALIARHRDGEGMEHTWALSRAIPKLSGASQELARLALVKRLSRCSAADLGKHLADRDVEVCRAAVLACAGKEDVDLVEHLAPLLEREEGTASLAATALNGLTGHDLPDAAAWRAWLADVAGE